MTTFWTQGGKILKDAMGKIIRCANCPCGGDITCGACSFSSSSTIDFYYGTAGYSGATGTWEEYGSTTSLVYNAVESDAYQTIWSTASKDGFYNHGNVSGISACNIAGVSKATTTNETVYIWMKYDCTYDEWSWCPTTSNIVPGIYDWIGFDLSGSHPGASYSITCTGGYFDFCDIGSPPDFFVDSDFNVN